jgi:hypothetical protein
MTSRALVLRRLVHRGQFGVSTVFLSVPESSLGAEVDDNQEGS